MSSSKAQVEEEHSGPSNIDDDQVLASKYNCLTCCLRLRKITYHYHYHIYEQQSSPYQQIHRNATPVSSVHRTHTPSLSKRSTHKQQQDNEEEEEEREEEQEEQSPPELEIHRPPSLLVGQQARSMLYLPSNEDSDPDPDTLPPIEFITTEYITPVLRDIDHHHIQIEHVTREKRIPLPDIPEEENRTTKPIKSIVQQMTHNHFRVHPNRVITTSPC